MSTVSFDFFTTSVGADAGSAVGAVAGTAALADGSAWDAIGKAYKRLELGDSEYLPAFFATAAGSGRGTR